jgi:hypothetical protein
MKISTLIDYFSTYNEESVLQAAAYYNRDRDLQSENRYSFDWELFEKIVSDIEFGYLIIYEDDIKEIREECKDEEFDDFCDCSTGWDEPDSYLDYYDGDDCEPESTSVSKYRERCRYCGSYLN